ncbi:MAG: hypothetical protein QM808_14510 [Steroidobacteraceae bacterium]
MHSSTPKLYASTALMMVLLAMPSLAMSAVLTPPLQATTGSERLPGAADNKSGPIAAAKPAEDRSKDCDAKCLTGLAERYLDALVRRDYKGLPVSPNLLVAENGHATRIGDGLWKVIEKLDAGKAYFTDPVAGQIVVVTTLEESAHQPFIFILRLKVEDRLIAEVESMVTADVNAAQHFRPDNLAEFDPITLAVLPKEQRLTRAQLTDVFNNVWYDSGKLTPALTAADSCIHWENGDRLALFKCGASQAFKPGGLSYTHRAVRRSVIDEERGVIITFVLKDTTPYLNPNPPDYERTPLFYQRPLTLYLMHIGKYQAGNKLLVDQAFMNAQEANMPAVFVE